MSVLVAINVELVIHVVVIWWFLCMNIDTVISSCFVFFGWFIVEMGIPDG